MAQIIKFTSPQVEPWAYTLEEGGVFHELDPWDTIPQGFHSLFFTNGYVFDRTWLELMARGKMPYVANYYKHLERQRGEEGWESVPE